MKFICKNVGVLFALSACTAVVHAGAPSTQELDDLFAEKQNADFSVSINNSARKEWRVGDSIKLHVKSKKACDLQMIHLDSNGVASLFNLGRVEANKETVFPKGVDYMSIEPPLGKDQIYAACSNKKMPQVDELSVPSTDNVVEADFVAKMSKRYASKLDKNALVAKLTYDVKGRNDELALVSDDIVSFYTIRSRTIKRPKLDLNVNFDFRSAELNDEGRALLDEVGKALNDDRMKGARFELNGHTDDIGSDEYNLDLSSQRAVTVGKYLQGAHKVDAGRVIPKGYGESAPKVENTDDDARAENRRVEFKLIRDL